VEILTISDFRCSRGVELISHEANQGQVLISSMKGAAKSFILQESAEPLSAVLVWAEPSQLLIGMWPFCPGRWSFAVAAKVADEETVPVPQTLLIQ
jgi:hypothetical protein